MNEQITTLPELVTALENHVEDRRYFEVMQSAAIPMENIERYLHWNQDHHTRVCIASNEHFELLLICWEKGQSGFIHDFASQEAWVHPISGRIREERFMPVPGEKGLECMSRVELGTREFAYMDGHVDIHRYSNINPARSVSMHLYAKPVKVWNVYDEETGNCKEEPVFYDHYYSRNRLQQSA